MRQAITLKKKRNGPWEMTAGPDVPYDKQRAEFHAQPGKNSVHNDVEQNHKGTVDKRKASVTASDAGSGTSASSGQIGKVEGAQGLRKRTGHGKQNAP